MVTEGHRRPQKRSRVLHQKIFALQQNKSRPLQQKRSRLFQKDEISLIPREESSSVAREEISSVPRGEISSVAIQEISSVATDEIGPVYTNFKRPQNGDNSSDLDDFWTDLIALTRAIIPNFYFCASGAPVANKNRKCGHSGVRPFIFFFHENERHTAI